MAKPVRISLANKCQILFGLAVVVILAAALAVPWLRMQTLVAEGQEETARKLAEAWLAGKIELGADLAGSSSSEDTTPANAPPGQSLTLRLIDRDEFELSASSDPFIDRAVELFETRDDRQELFEPSRGPDGRWVYHYARAIRKSGLSRISQGDVTSYESGLETSALADPLQVILLLDLRTDLVENQLQRNRIYILLAGLLAGLLAIGAFWFITTRLILSPVRVLRDTAEKVSEGDLNIRSEIGTGDEFQQLAETFNSMLESLKKNEDQLRGVNKSLDLKLGELAQSNVALYEANRIKNEFLANVSHELRTPLHSIIGFAEVLGESLEQAGAPLDDKRRRYATNIALSSRRLLDLINDLLDLAKIEAGKIDLHLAVVSISDTLEGLANLLRPQAEKSKLEIRLKIDRDLPVIESDPGKVQQILFNFLSNALKFSPAAGTITVEATLLPANVSAPGSAGGSTTPAGDDAQIKISVTDQGPGIALEDHARIFEKFVQLDVSVTREYGGTGLGLTISRDLAKLLSGRIELDSDLGRGATFSLILPVRIKAKTTPLMPATEPART